MKTCMRLGLLINEMDTGYSKDLISGIQSFRLQNQINLIIFSGRAYGWPYGYEYQRTAIFKHINLSNIDVLIIASGTQCNYIPLNNFLEFTESLKPLPIISIAIPLPGIPSVMSDNRLVFRKLLAHIVDVHKRSDFLFMGGPEANNDAHERFFAFTSFLNEKKIKINTDHFIESDFSVDGGQLALRKYLERHSLNFNVLVCANDNMARGCAVELKKQGYRIPEDVLLTGFDDIPRARFEDPPLTTILQDVYQEGVLAVQYAFDVFNGRSVPPVTVVPANLVIRGSCGCPSSDAGLLMDCYQGKLSVEEPDADTGKKIRLFEDEVNRFISAGPDGYALFLDAIRRQLSDYPENERINSRWQQIINFSVNELSRKKRNKEDAELFNLAIQGARVIAGDLEFDSIGKERITINDSIYLLRDYFSILSSVVSFDVFIETLRQQLELFQIKRCAIILFKTEIWVEKNSAFNLPHEAEVVLAFDEKTPYNQKFKAIHFDPSHNVLPENILASIDGMLVALSLYHRCVQLGYILFEPGNLGGNMYETICVQISNTIRSSLIFSEKLSAEEKLLDAMRELELYNKKLNAISLTDELTGLQNRRGFLALGQQSLDLAMRMKKTVLVVFSDMDGLKIINDSFGHEAGDRAIVAMAKIFQKVFRSMDVLSRLGGDEFAVLAIEVSENFIETLRKRLNKGLESFNKNTKEKFRLSVSLGFAVLQRGEEVNLETLMYRADQVLYEEKRRKKSGLS